MEQKFKCWLSEVIKSSADRIGTHCKETQKKGEVSNQNICQDLKVETPQETVFKLLNMKSCGCTFVNRTVSSWWMNSHDGPC